MFYTSRIINKCKETIKQFACMVSFLLASLYSNAQTAGTISEANVVQAKQYLLELIIAANETLPFQKLKGTVQSKERDGTTTYRVKSKSRFPIRTAFLLQQNGQPLTYKSELNIKSTAAIVEAIKSGISIPGDTTNSYTIIFNDTAKARGVYKWILQKEDTVIAVFRNNKFRNIGYLEVPATANEKP